MTVWLVSRHPGAAAWAAQQGLQFDRHVDHFDPQWVAAGDRIVGTLPIHLAAAVCARGAEYWHLALDVQREDRGREWTLDDMLARGARLERYHITLCENEPEKPTCPI